MLMEKKRLLTEHITPLLAHQVSTSALVCTRRQVFICAFLETKHNIHHVLCNFKLFSVKHKIDICYAALVILHQFRGFQTPKNKTKNFPKNEFVQLFTNWSCVVSMSTKLAS